MMVVLEENLESESRLKVTIDSILLVILPCTVSEVPAKMRG